MKKLLVYIIFSVIVCKVSPQTAGDEDKEMFNRAKQRDQQAIDDALNSWWTATMKTHEQRIEWWREAKFGMFIHWGIYSLPGGEWKGKKVTGYAEHLMRKEKISRNEYLELAHQFNPVQFNAEEWILNAKRAGMKYFIITAKHHDGFALYDSEVSTFNILKQTPFKQDPMKELAAAAKKHGIKFGFYYSHAFDWEHTDAPGNDWEYNNPGGDKLLGGANWYDTHPEWLPKATSYVNEKAIPQIKELLTKYHPDILWFDTPHKLPLSENIRILKAIRETDQHVIVNGRLVRNAAANFGDYKNTADRPAEFYPVTGNWEAIPTTNESYGYHKYDSSHKSLKHFIQLLASAASRGGNLLMNIGPKGDGAFDDKDLAILNGIGKWMEKNGESIYGTAASRLPLQSWGVTTTKKNKLYLHIFRWPTDGKLYVGGLSGNPVNAHLLGVTAPKLPIIILNTTDVYITIPLKAPDTINTVIALELKQKSHPDVTAFINNDIRFIAPNSRQDRLLAYDATQQGKGFSFGDGKTDRYYIEGWKSKEQNVTWDFRTNSVAAFKVVIKYIAPKESAGGTYTLRFDDRYTERMVRTTEKNTDVVTEEILTQSIDSGIHSIKISPLSFGKSELMKLLEIQLIRVD